MLALELDRPFDFFSFHNDRGSFNVDVLCDLLEVLKMKLEKFAVQRKLPDSFDVNRIPVKHPEAGEKIYILSIWSSGFWYRKNPSRGDGPIHPCQFNEKLAELEVHSDAEKEIA